MPRWVLCCVTFLGFLSNVDGQTFLYLKKSGGKMAVTYKSGEEIRFQLKEDEHFSVGTIEGFGWDSFFIHETEIKLSDIHRIDIRRKHNHNFNYQVSSNTLFIATGLLPLAEIANQQVSGSGNNTGIHRSIWTTSGILVAGGLIIKALEPKYFKPGFRKKATIITKD